MIEILFVEDEVNKAREIKSFLTQQYDRFSISEEKSFQGAINSIRKNKYDLILLDMSLPLSDDGLDFETFAGVDVLEELTRLESKSPVIVITAFDVLIDINTNESVKLVDLDKEMFEDYQNIYKGVIQYNISSVQWKDLLSKKILDIIGGGKNENFNC